MQGPLKGPSKGIFSRIFTDLSGILNKSFGLWLTNLVSECFMIYFDLNLIDCNFKKSSSA